MKHSSDSRILERLSLNLSADIVVNDWGRAYIFIILDCPSDDIENVSVSATFWSEADTPEWVAKANASDSVNKNTVRIAFKRRPEFPLNPFRSQAIIFSYF